MSATASSKQIAAEQTFIATMKIAAINPYVEVPVALRRRSGRAGDKRRVLVKVRRVGSRQKSAAAKAAKAKVARDASRLKAIARLGRGGWFRTTIVPSRSGLGRLYLDLWMRDQAGLEVGDRVHVRIREDRGSRELPLPKPLTTALRANRRAQAAWDALSPSRRREILRYLNFLKTPAALESNVRKVMAQLA